MTYDSRLFVPGKLTFVMDAQFGSSGKGKIASYIGETNKGKFQFACNAFSAQAGHWVRLENGKQFFYQHLNSVAYNQDLYEKIYIGPAACIELPALLREIEENKIHKGALGVHPLASLILTGDMEYERGVRPFDYQGRREDIQGKDLHSGTSATGSTNHGVGSAGARKMLRRPSVVLAKDVPELSDYICDVSAEVLTRLRRGESGLCEIAQGFPLSLNYGFYPHCTSRNVTVSQALSDMFLPPNVAGPVVLNMRTFPIRISSNKYIGEDGSHLTWAEVQAGVPHTVFQGNSGGWFSDQKELSWDDLTRDSGSKTDLTELTSVTKLPRRVATFSPTNLLEAIKFNDTGYEPVLSLNFVNYIDANMLGARSVTGLTDKFRSWMEANIPSNLVSNVRYLGTGALTEDTIEL